jgi:hypothetical protein
MHYPNVPSRNVPSPAAPHDPPGARNLWPRRVLSALWALIPALSLGLLAPVPSFHAAIKLRRWWLWVTASLYTVAEVVAFSAIPEAESAEISDAAAGTLFALMIVPTVQAFAVRRRVFGLRQPDPAPWPQDPAIAAALRGRQRREEARQLAARDPSLARELRIGRPDLPRQYDDGGLIDVNHAPVPVLARGLGLSEADAARLAQARDHVGGFSSPEEIIAFSDLSPAVVDGIRDHLVFLR